MATLKRLWESFKDFFGFRFNSKYVRDYLNDANIKSSKYMSAIIIILELWLIYRQIHQYIIPYWGNPGARGYSNSFMMTFGYLSLYFLFIMCSVAVLIFSLLYKSKIQSKKAYNTNIVMGTICVLWPFLLFFENAAGTIRGGTINITTLFLLYFSMPLLGISIIGNTVFKRTHGKNNTALSILVIISFSIVCLLFGMKVGYSDYTSTTRPKMIITFLTMIIFVACLLIWRPYISILMLTSLFTIFLLMLKSYNPGNLDTAKRIWQDGDEINYITFLISLTMISISIYQQRVAEAKKDEKLIHDAIYDTAIDVHNIRYLINKVNENITNRNRIFLFINLTNFKIINEQYGFETGDEFLKNFSDKVKTAFKGDWVARQSDDHFVVYAHLDGYKDKINKLDNDIKNLTNGLFINLKVGGYIQKENESPKRAIDKARYASNFIKKKYGVNYLEYDSKLDEIFTKRQYIVNHIDEAIERGYIVPYYQPVVWSSNEELCGAEALARWIDPVYGLLPPSEFIPILEENRLIHKLDAGIIESVCKNMREAIDSNRPVVPISINFSRLDFELMNVEELLDKILAKYNIDKDFIHVEITESALADDTDILNNIITSLKSKGYAIWLDDFGSGYSSLNVLKDFVFDVIKIDMKFLNNFDTNEKTKDILDYIIKLADKLGMKTLTEGVETTTQAEFLESIGCGRLQGYLFGKPYSLSEFEAKINSQELVVSKKIL